MVLLKLRVRVLGLVSVLVGCHGEVLVQYHVVFVEFPLELLVLLELVLQYFLSFGVVFLELGIPLVDWHASIVQSVFVVESLLQIFVFLHFGFQHYLSPHVMLVHGCVVTGKVVFVEGMDSG